MYRVICVSVNFQVGTIGNDNHIKDNQLYFIVECQSMSRFGAFRNAKSLIVFCIEQYLESTAADSAHFICGIGKLFSLVLYV